MTICDCDRLTSLIISDATSRKLSGAHRRPSVGPQGAQRAQASTTANLKPACRKEPFDVYCRILHAYTIIYVNIGFFSASCFFHPFYTGSLSSCGILASSNIHVLYMFSHHTRFIHVMSLYMHYPSACLVGDNR